MCACAGRAAGRSRRARGRRPTGDEGVVARDHVDLARRGARAGRDGRRAGGCSRVAGCGQHGDGDQGDGSAA